MSKLNYEKLNRHDRASFRPSWRSQPATQRQLDYIVLLAHQKGQPKPKLPKTKYGAGEMIERLLALPSVPFEATATIRPPDPAKPVNEARAELTRELRASYPQLTPMSVNSLIQLFMQVDELGTYLFFAELPAEEAPEELEALIPWIMRAFLDWLS